MSSGNALLPPTNAPEQKTDKTSAFIEVLTLTDDQIIKCSYLARTWLLLTVLIPVEAVSFCPENNNTLSHVTHVMFFI